MKEQKNDRVFNNSDVDEITMKEYYLKVFEVICKLSSPVCTHNYQNAKCMENRLLCTMDVYNEHI
ncbi:MAG: hypothetical protein SOZ34_01195 [Clostridia bacterium]|nr:hypothetical protein [Clostridia bacterium]